MDLKKMIRNVPDFPKKGIIFKDITPLLKDKEALKAIVEAFTERYNDKKIDLVASVEARGFLLGSIIAYKIGAGMVPVRKKGKLPYEIVSITYDLEYGTDRLELHSDVLRHGISYGIVDDLIATGGTAAATIRLAQKYDADIACCTFLIELGFLRGREKLNGCRVESLLIYE